MEIWFRENVSDAEWVAHAESCREKARKIEEDKQRIYDEDGYAFYHDGMMRSSYSEARLADQKGIGMFFKLMDFNGNVVDARIVDGKFGKVWCVQNSDGSVSWVNVSQAKDEKREAAFYESKGYRVAWVEYKSYYRGGVKQIPDSEPISIQYVGELESPIYRQDSEFADA